MDNHKNGERPLTTKYIAEMFGVDVTTVLRWADDGKLPYFRTPGGHHRYFPEDIRKLIEEWTNR